MPSTNLRQTLKVWMLPIAMAGGILFHNYMGYLSPFSPYLIGLMLFFTYCRLKPHEMKVTKFSLILLAVQVGGGIALYFILSPFNELVAQTAFICVFCPTATAAPVITGMLGGSISKLAAFSLVSNFAVALLAPALFSYIGAHGHGNDLSFFYVTGLISLKVVPIILGPLFLAMIVEVLWPSLHAKVAAHQNVSFYAWAISLFIVVGNAVSYVISHLSQNADEGILMIELASVSLLFCLLQFYIGRKVGRRYGDKISGAQGLGQKNTVLAVWMALTFLSPITSIGPAAYVAWQNTINSLQLWLKTKRERSLTV